MISWCRQAFAFKCNLCRYIKAAMKTALWTRQRGKLLVDDGMCAEQLGDEDVGGRLLQRHSRAHREQLPAADEGDITLSAQLGLLVLLERPLGLPVYEGHEAQRRAVTSAAHLRLAPLAQHAPSRAAVAARR